MTEVIEEQKKLVSRHAARFIAILSLYSFEMHKQKSLKSAAHGMLKSYLNKDVFYFNDVDDSDVQAPDELFLDQLIQLIEDKENEVSELVKNNLIEKYSFSKLDRVIKSILKLVSAELLFCGDIPAKVIIDEYVGLTKVFYEKNEAGFVNKVADVLARFSRPNEVK